YVYNNISANPGGLWWPARTKDPEFGARLGFAYYLDGGFKNYLFNNIAWGRSNKAHDTEANGYAFYEAVGTIHNSYMNNTIYRFQSGSSWSPRGGHHKFAGNLWSDISNQVFTHGKLKEDKSKSSKEYPHGSMAYGPNVFHKIRKYGHFENVGPENKKMKNDFSSMASAVKKNKTLNGSLGISTNKAPMRNPAKHDMRLVPGSAAINKGVKHFVPWGLYGMVGEWNFYHDGKNINRILDEHWYMTDYLTERGTYHQTPQFPLKVVNITKANYVNGPLESWVKGALKLNGKNQYAVLTHAAMSKPFTYKKVIGRRKTTDATARGITLKNPNIYTSNFLVEIYVKVTSPGILVEKMAGSGYSLTVNARGGISFRIKGNGTAKLDSKAKVNDGKWHHIIAEADRKTKKLTLYIDGKKDKSGKGIGGDSIANSGDLYIGGSPKGRCINGTVEFVRICQGTIKDARTSIGELYAWQFKGPHLRDFVGKKPDGKRDAGALEYQK
ncbi:MAG: LamG domain-containing protein, partial [Lentisphaeria bacterium]|nr:LamG domain-containing protein [Lentisphaeria bacterium]NQZ67435.1 LamG domain-containing protein [Lentisphaeria bacterium]